MQTVLPGLLLSEISCTGTQPDLPSYVCVLDFIFVQIYKISWLLINANSAKKLHSPLIPDQLTIGHMTLIQGICQYRTNICRACVTKLHLEQSDGSNYVVFYPDCKQSAFQIDNLIVNESLCAAISDNRLLRRNHAIDVDVDASGTGLVKKLRRSDRIAVPEVYIKIENANQGVFKCPRECRCAITMSEAGCNVITCKGHSGFRSKDNLYNHPRFIHFCVHCKVECTDNYYFPLVFQMHE